VITFGRATDGKLGQSQERLFAPSAMVYTLKEHGRKAGKPSDAAAAFQGEPAVVLGNADPVAAGPPALGV
jgi:hypothetical protein